MIINCMYCCTTLTGLGELQEFGRGVLDEGVDGVHELLELLLVPVDGRECPTALW